MGCASPPRLVCSEAGPPVEIDRDAYVAVLDWEVEPYHQYAFDLVARYRNTTADTVYLTQRYFDQTRPDYAVVDTTGRRRSAYDPLDTPVGRVWLPPNTAPAPPPPVYLLPVPPCGVRADTLRVIGPNGWTASDEPFGALEGAFRLAYSVRGCGGRCVLPDTAATSGWFTVSIE